jgi:hypothetical protein
MVVENDSRDLSGESIICLGEKEISPKVLKITPKVLKNIPRVLMITFGVIDVGVKFIVTTQAPVPTTTDGH